MGGVFINNGEIHAGPKIDAGGKPETRLPQTMAGKETKPLIADQSMKERYEAAMVLGAVGDAMGYKNSRWEFEFSGERIHGDLKALGGLFNLHIEQTEFSVSDDTILHLATAEGLTSGWTSREQLLDNIATRYVSRCAEDMNGRAPGATTLNGVGNLCPGEPDGLVIPFNRSGGGCGAAMRSCPIGLAFSRPDQLDDLIAVSVETGRLTHNHPTGFLGSLASALFVAYGIQGKPLREWGAGLLETVDKAERYVEKVGRDVDKIKDTWGYFKRRWTEYLKERGISDGMADPTFPQAYGVVERDDFYNQLSFDGWGGASGHDAPMIAYDALLGGGDSWEEVCLRGMLHGGDCDSTGIIAGSVWGAVHGFKTVPDCNYKDVEFAQQLIELAHKLYEQTNKCAV